MSLQWKSNKQQLMSDLEIASYYKELESEFEEAKNKARSKRKVTKK